MMRTDLSHGSRLIRVAVAATVLALVAGCSGPTAGPDPSATSSSRPLDAYLNPPVDQAKSQEQQRKIEELVAQCMKDQGFEYTPREPSDSDQEALGPRGGERQPDRAWVEKYGYGISTMDDQPDQESKDPNSERLEKMTEKQREAYFKALHGEGGGGAFSSRGGGPAPVGPANGEGGDGGCYGKAQQEVYPDAKPVDFDEFKDLFDAIAKLDDQVKSDPRIAPLIKEWSGCLAGAGYSGFTEPEDPEQSIMKKWADLNGWKYEEGEGGGTTMSRPAEGGEDAKAPDPEKVAKIRAEELKLALADFDCRADYVATVEQVRNELELRFIEEHREQLERYRDLINQGR